MLSFNTMMVSSSSYADIPTAAMHLAFPTPLESSLGTPNLFVLNNLLQYLCKCAQTHKSPISKKMHLLYVAINPTLYGHYSSGRHTPMWTILFLYMLWMYPTTVDAPTPTIAPMSKSPMSWHSSNHQHELCSHWHFPRPCPSCIQTILQADLDGKPLLDSGKCGDCLQRS
jgi:hypothetical protein